MSMPKATAVVGMGYWGNNLVRNFHDLGALACVCDPDSGVKSIVAERFSGVRYCADYSEVLADSKIAAVALATPAVTHYTLAKRALEAGKDVFVEKPLAVELS